MAMVPPRDPSQRDKWLQSVYNSQQSGFRRMPAASQEVGDPTLIDTVLVIMANFSDFAFVSSREDVDSMFNGMNWTKDDAKGSVRQYFYDQSSGQYNPYFKVVGPVTLPNGYAYYGQGKNKTARPGEMVADACKLVDDEVDFTRYDNNNDGDVDLVFVLFAGFGENDPPSGLVPSIEDLPWPHYWNMMSAGISQDKRTFDDKLIYAYEISNELDGYYSTKEKKVVAGIGVVCHEYGHALGLPDLYETNSDNKHNQKLLGAWDIMSDGAYDDDMHSPPSYSAYERFFMGWLEPTLITEADDLQLEHIATSNKAYLISESDTHNLNGVNPNPAVFYLLENRLRASWDRGLPGNGLMITRINYQRSRWTSNSVNNAANNMGVDIIEADGKKPIYDENNKSNGYYGKSSDLFPKGANECLEIPDHAITDITLENGIVSFKYRGGKPVGPTTDIRTSAEQTACKIIRDGQLLIYRDGHSYSIFGMRQD